ncbi:inactive hydroxysteroid dehydrogenase-like protein 1 [Culicoides brevitarsis]|uniref:inactive hydroxysteroid dehydrogenase-like protein 1 n=1 Tax=Culicoides brevitarsis TaxID=469753 RepID=UPI00307BDA51
MFTQFCVFVVIAQFLRFTIPWLYRNFIGPQFFSESHDFKKYGSWAVITGASTGIGRCFAKQLAAKGINLVLISNEQGNLESAARKIKNRFKVKTIIVNVDFRDGISVYDVIKDEIKDLDVGILVNNVGIGYPGPLHFHELAAKEDFLWDILAVNLIPTTFMTKLVIDRMLEKKSGLILNISSLDATFPVPVCLYSACKSYMNKFTEDFNIEYQGKGILMQSINPGPVKTNVWCVEMGPWMKPDADTYVASAIKSVGMGNNAIGYYPHVLLQLAVRGMNFLCPFLYKKVIWMNHRATKYP